MTRSMALFAASQAGEVLEVDFRSQLQVWVAAYMRCKIMLNLNNLLVSGFYLDREEGEKLWIQFRYEKVADLCFHCGRLGHSQNICIYEPGEVQGPHGYSAIMRAETLDHRRYSSPLSSSDDDRNTSQEHWSSASRLSKEGDRDIMGLSSSIRPALSREKKADVACSSSSTRQGAASHQSLLEDSTNDGRTPPQNLQTLHSALNVERLSSEAEQTTQDLEDSTDWSHHLDYMAGLEKLLTTKYIGPSIPNIPNQPRPGFVGFSHSVSLQISGDNCSPLGASASLTPSGPLPDRMKNKGVVIQELESDEDIKAWEDSATKLQKLEAASHSSMDIEPSRPRTTLCLKRRLEF